MSAWDYSALASLISDETGRTVTLSASSLGVLTCVLEEMTKRYRWQDDGEDVSDAQFDVIEAWVAGAYLELMTDVECEGAAMEIGSIFVWPNSGATIPSNCLPCDGTEYLKSAYADLYAALGSSWESDTTHFVVPDLRERVVVGKGGAFAFGETGGEATHVLTTSELPAHTHGIVIGAPSGDGGRVMRGTSQQTNQVTESTGDGDAHENMPPYLALVWVIVAL